MIRTAEFYGFKEIYIYDLNELMSPPSNKVTRADMNHMARVWTAGAIEFIDIIKVDNPKRFVLDHHGRSIATVVSRNAKSLHSFYFQKDDLIVMGSEKEGLPEEFIGKCSHQVFIPNLGNTDCLNVSVTLGIVMNEAIRQLSVD